MCHSLASTVSWPSPVWHFSTNTHTRARARILAHINTYIHIAGGGGGGGGEQGKHFLFQLPLDPQCAQTCMLSPFLIGRMFLREPSWKYSANLVGS